MVTKGKTLVNKIMKGETSMSPRWPCLREYKKQVGQSPISCPQDLEKNGGFAAAFFSSSFLTFNLDVGIK